MANLWDHHSVIERPGPVLRTNRGVLYDGDCVTILKDVKDETIDTVFADPPFNIGKVYGSKVNDDRPDEEYIQWCHRWIDECVRALKPGGILGVEEHRGDPELPQDPLAATGYVTQEHLIKLAGQGCHQSHTGAPVRVQISRSRSASGSPTTW